MTIKRIYADFNGLVPDVKNPNRTAVVLDTIGSLQDLSNAGLILSEGLPLIAFDWSDESEDLEGHGTAHWDRDRRWWVVEFDDAGVRYVPAGDRTPVVEFLCVSCRQPIPGMPGKGFSAKTVCQSCGTSILAAYAPPNDV